MNLNYSLNGISFLSLGVLVASSSGVLDGLALKEPFAVNWPDAHGQVVDLLRPRYEAREIKLDCFLIAQNPEDLITKQSGLIAQLARSGTQRLRINPVEGKPLVYEVYSKSGFALKKKWREASIPAEFTLTLIEPQPVKWVLSAVGGSTVSLNLSADSPLKLHWGDNSTTEFIGGVAQTLTHTYGGNNTTTYYLVVAGELERMTVHAQTNLTEVWPRLY